MNSDSELPTTDEDARKMSVLRRLQATLWGHMVIVRISAVRNDEEIRFHTASGTLVRLHGRAMLATAWHVIKEYVDIRASGDTPILQLGNSQIVAPAYAFLDSYNDIIFLDVPENAIENSGGTPLDLSRQWPPLKVTTEYPILITGFPALLRQVGDELLQGDYNYLGNVESVSEHQFLVQMDPDDLISIGREPMPSLDSDLGGLSGSPAIALYPDHTELVGIFSQALESAPVWIVRSIAHLPDELADLPSVAV